MALKRGIFKRRCRTAAERKLDAERKTFIFETGGCWICWGLKLLTVHEIACGAHRHNGVKSRAAWLCLCLGCHQTIQSDLVAWPIARQLALKRARDAEHYDRVAVNKMRGRADEAITEAEVDQFSGD